MDVERAIDMLAGVRVFVTTRERIKHPEGTDLFDEAIRVLREHLADRHGAGDAEAWRTIESAPSEGVIELAVTSKAGADRRAMVAERSFRDGEPYWMVTHGWVGWTTLHPAWTPYAWRPLPAPPTDDAARAGERGVTHG